MLRGVVSSCCTIGLAKQQVFFEGNLKRRKGENTNRLDVVICGKHALKISTSFLSAKVKTVIFFLNRQFIYKNMKHFA